MSDKWQCSEEQARAVESACWTAPEHAKRSACRAAITAAIGPEIDRLRAELAEVRAQAEADHAEIETLNHYRVEAQRCDARAAAAESYCKQMHAEAVSDPKRWTYWRQRSAEMTAAWREQRDAAESLRAALAERDGRRCDGCEHCDTFEAPQGFAGLCSGPIQDHVIIGWHCADWRKREG